MSQLRRPRTIAFAALATTLLVTSCGSGDSGSGSGSGSTSAASGSSAASGETRSFAADNGNVTIPVHPQRIVATGYAVPVLLESQAPLVGISDWSRGVSMMSPEVKKKYDTTPRVSGGAAAETNYEAIAKADPDLIVISVPKAVLGDLKMDRLTAIAPVVVIAPTTPDAWKKLSERQLDAAGRQDDLKKAKDAYEAKANELKTKYAPALTKLKFGHFSDSEAQGSDKFTREYAHSWGTNIAQDVGVNYDGHVAKATGGSGDSSEALSLEQITSTFGKEDAITYTSDPSGPTPMVQKVLSSPLFAQLPAKKNNRVFPLPYTAAASYGAAMMTLDGIDKAFAPLLTQK